MIRSLKGLLTLAVICAAIAISSTNSYVVESARPITDLRSGEIAQSGSDGEQRRSVDFERSSPNEMTPEKSRDIYYFHRVISLLPVIAGVIVIGLIGMLFVVNKKKISKQLKRNTKPIIAISICIVAVATIAIALYASSRNSRDVNCPEIIAEFNEKAKNDPMQELTEEMAYCMEDK